jgi:hypothetical protein
LERTIGSVYYSFGDEPDVAGEREPPCIVMPAWAADQFIVSEAGEEPDLCGDIAGLGMLRTNGLKAYINAVDATLDELSTTKVYTWCIWGLSQFADVAQWEARGGPVPGLKLDMNSIFGDQAVQMIMYELDGLDETDTDRRHLPSRRKVWSHVHVWSATKSSYKHPGSNRLGDEVRLDSCDVVSVRPRVKSRVSSPWRCFAWCKTGL